MICGFLPAGASAARSSGRLDEAPDRQTDGDLVCEVIARDPALRRGAAGRYRDQEYAAAADD